ncbi:uncharacterized protein LOC117949600 [Etheostoma cragini]|uniref:uncharacterized protein LOC117949600 n=1 Tax=Etheostoma cragini TaxID=417921 RepID=UPI00155E6B3F|nr:uncharacterized protein LOC117949600 [Etheostoma cragini]
MIKTEVVLEALNVLCHAGVERPEDGMECDASGGRSKKEVTIHDFIPLALCGRRSGNQHLAGANPDWESDISLPKDIRKRGDGRLGLQLDYNWSYKHLDPRYDYDFTKLNDTRVYFRGDEKYKRPCGWQRFALKVLDEFGDNAWLGNQFRSTQSVSGEWPVSYHGTQEKFVEAIIGENYKKGPGQRYGLGIYSTPDIDIAERFAVEFTANSTRKKYKVIMQNRINPGERQVCQRKDFWLVQIHERASLEEEKEIVRKAIRPYGLLLKEV